jgi:hypothetical protein
MLLQVVSVGPPSPFPAPSVARILITQAWISELPGPPESQRTPHAPVLYLVLLPRILTSGLHSE